MNNTIKPFSILFVEDEKEIRENYINYLKQYFKNVYGANDGEEGYSIYKKYKPEILIIDINLPKLNGIDMLKKIRQHDHTTKAIMLTAHCDIDYLLDATELKLTKYLVKPISRNELHDSLELALNELKNFTISSKKILTLKENFIWDYATQELLNNYNTVVLTPKEREILKLFFDNTNKVLTYDEIIMSIWDDFNINNFDTLKTIIKNLRRKLPDNTIQNIYSIGYTVKIIL